MTSPTDPAALFDMPAARPTDLLGRFGIPPLTVFDRRQGYWQNRKRAWIGMGIASGDGRDGALAFVGREDADDFLSEKILAVSGGTSIFDPVIAEILLRWYCPPAGKVYDPFAGGSVRGIVTMALGRHYRGRDVREEQIEANIAQAVSFVDRHGDAGGTAIWDHADGTTAYDGTPVDMILTCPPYGDLEVYSEQADDISTMSRDDFADAYMDAVVNAVNALAPNRFSCWVVGNYRDKRSGDLVDLVGLTIGAHLAAGARFHTENIIVDPVGTGAMRAAATFKALRRPIRVHQQCLVFVKGDPKAAADDAEAFTEDQVAAMMTP